ncbi:hypothetical protein [Pseudomonas frederiksbergensis]|jgi:hypothetical protein|uniref:hypothetical protein n=1 Tax=Pseudomonas frederiksbergensis TaxID=104087 RepID=UPI0012FD738D|nr:hypothetical protein [Pseudomonas frederiksbergensis]
MSDDAKSAGARAGQGDKGGITKADLDQLPHVDSTQTRKPGRLKGKIRMSADFDSTTEDIIEGFKDGFGTHRAAHKKSDTLNCTSCFQNTVNPSNVNFDWWLKKE